jgi:hypothetical protein
MKQENHNTQLFLNQVRKKETSIQTSNIFYLLKKYNSYSIYFAEPYEAVLPVDTISIKQGETIHMTWACFLKKSRNNHEALLTRLIQKRKPENSFGEEVTLQRRENQQLRKNNRRRADVTGNETFIEREFFKLLWL